MENTIKNYITNHRKLLISIGAVLLCIAAICICLALRLRAPDLSTICGFDTSNMLFKDVQEQIEDKVNDYSLHLTVGDQILDISADELGLVFLKEDFKSVVQSMADSGADADPWSVLSLDHEKLKTYIADHFDEKRTQPVPATVAWDDAKGCFKVIPGVPETLLDPELLADFILDAIANLQTDVEITEDLLYTEIQDHEQLNSVEQLADRANELMQLELEYAFKPRQVDLGFETIDEAMIASFLRFDYENNLVYADEKAVSTYVESIAPEYAYFKNKDRFIAHDGARIDVQITFQKQNVDTAALTAMILDSINSGVSGSFEAPYTGFVNFEGDYIEVSIPEQHLWVYQDGVVVLESDVVTGNKSLGKRTPRGLNMVRGHLQSIYLVDNYFVDYWLCISMDGTYGFHDADRWREPEEYGGDTYLTHGSGGCVNVPLENMAKMYEMVPDRTPIVIYDEYYYD